MDWCICSMGYRFFIHKHFHYNVKYFGAKNIKQHYSETALFESALFEDFGYFYQINNYWWCIVLPGDTGSLIWSNLLSYYFHQPILYNSIGGCQSLRNLLDNLSLLCFHCGQNWPCHERPENEIIIYDNNSSKNSFFCFANLIGVVFLKEKRLQALCFSFLLLDI